MRLAPIARYVLELQTGFCGAECGLFPLAWTSVEDGSIGCAESLGWPSQSLRRLTLLHFANHPQTTNYAPDPFDLTGATPTDSGMEQDDERPDSKFFPSFDCLCFSRVREISVTDVETSRFVRPDAREIARQIDLDVCFPAWFQSPSGRRNQSVLQSRRWSTDVEDCEQSVLDLRATSL